MALLAYTMYQYSQYSAKMRLLRLKTLVVDPFTGFQRALAMIQVTCQCLGKGHREDP